MVEQTRFVDNLHEGINFLKEELITRESLLLHVSRPLYIHFLDREMLTCVGAYDFLRESVVYEDLLMILLATHEKTYLSTSLVFENKFARQIYKQLYPLFQRGHIQIAQKENSLRDFALSKKEQYPPHVKEMYPFYYDETWEKIEAIGPIRLHKQLDTSLILEEAIVSDLTPQEVMSSAKHLGVTVYHDEIAKLNPYIIEAVTERKDRAVTKLLFADLYRKFLTNPVSQQCFNIKISENYVNAYISEYDGTLATGLGSGIEYFSYLCPTFPFHHIPLWREVNLRLGSLPIARKFTAIELAKIRDEKIFHDFVDEFRFFIAKAIQSRFANSGPFANNTALTQYLERTLRAHLKAPPVSTDGVEGYLRILEKATRLLRSIDTESNPSSHLKIKSWRTIPMNNTVFVVYGRNKVARTELFSLLRAAGLKPLEWEQALKLTGKASPYIGEVIDKALDEAQAIVVLFTGDDCAALKEELLEPNELAEPLTPQPRPNVILEAGIALGKNPDRTILVQIGKIREISDLLGRHVVRLDNSVEKRKDLLTRLQSAGCSVDLTGSDWMSTGTF